MWCSVCQLQESTAKKLFFYRITHFEAEKATMSEIEIESVIMLLKM